MSVASRSRTRMTMRAVIARNSTSTTDAYGHPDAPVFATLGDPIPCRAWSVNRREVDDTRKFVIEENLRCAIPLGTDVTENDRITQIQDRLSVVLWAGPWRIDDIQYKHTHLEMDLRRVES